MAKKINEQLEPCYQEGRITVIEGDVKDIKNSLNGVDGLMAIVVKQVEVTNTQGENIDKLVTMVDVLRVKDIETDKELEVKKGISKKNHELVLEKKVQRRWFVGIVLTVIALAFTFCKVFLK